MNAAWAADAGVRQAFGLSIMQRAFPHRFVARAAWLRRVPLIRRFVRERDGATAIEFGLVAAPFLAMVFAIMETAIIFFAGQTLETAGADSARLIMTGQAQTQGFSQNQFKQAVCGKIHGLFKCDAGLQVDVRTYTGFSQINTGKPIKADGTLDNNFVYQPGGPGDIVVVRLIYQWPVYVSLLGLNLGDMSGNKRLLVSTVAFRNEPYK
jgi:Flp pilus assembly protein TadG